MCLSRSRLIIIFLLSVLIVLGIFSSDFFSFSNLKTKYHEITQLYQTNSYLYGLIFFGLLLLASSIPTPLVSILSIAAGAIYGFLFGLAFVSIACSLGATASVIGFRTIFPQNITTFNEPRLNEILRRIDSSPFFYALCLRLVPGMPFFIGNAALSITRVGTITILLTTVIGMLPTFALLTFSGSQMSQFNSINDILNFNFFLTIGLILCALIACRAVVIKYTS